MPEQLLPEAKALSLKKYPACEVPVSLLLIARQI
jgi:hypothetical protein